MEAKPLNTKTRIRQKGKTVKVPLPVIIRDSREWDMGYSFEYYDKIIAGVEVKKLNTGDYSVKGMEDRITIERKTLEDAVGSIIRDRERFIKECKRLAKYDRKYIIIEACLEDIKQPYEESRAHPNAVLGSYLALQERWNIPVLFACNYEYAEELTANILTKYYTLHWLEENGYKRYFIEGDI